MATERDSKRRRKRLGNRLDPIDIPRLKKKPGLHADGLGLYLRVTPDLNGSWVFRYKVAGRERWMGLGGASVVKLAEARKAAGKAREAIAAGTDPLDARKAKTAEAAAERARAMTFKDAATACIKAMTPNWGNAKHATQWTNTLDGYAFPVLGKLPVGEVDTAAVLKVLEPIWTTKPETAGRVRGRIERVLNWARAAGKFKGTNPAIWRGHLDQLLPMRSKVRKVRHHPALPYPEIGDFLATLRKQPGDAAQALELLILTATRTGEIIGAKWDEVDLDRQIWTIPEERMKAGKPHRVPLAPRAVDILEARWERRERQKEADRSQWVFPGPKGKHMSNGAMLALLKRMKRADITAHGFRSSFRDWAAEMTAFPNHVIEMALAHAIGDEVERAYRRGDLFKKREKLMEAWAGYCARPAAKGGNVEPLHQRKAKA